MAPFSKFILLSAILICIMRAENISIPSTYLGECLVTLPVVADAGEIEVSYTLNGISKSFNYKNDMNQVEEDKSKKAMEELVDKFQKGNYFPKKVNPTYFNDGKATMDFELETLCEMISELYNDPAILDSYSCDDSIKIENFSVKITGHPEGSIENVYKCVEKVLKPYGSIIEDLHDTLMSRVRS